MLRHLYTLLALVSIASNCPLLPAQEAKDKPIYDDPEVTDADFSYVGEYQGVLPTDEGDKKFGTHVIARGNGKFEIVSYQGGLPGDGWNRETPLRFTAQRDGERIRVDADQGHGIIQKDAITAYDSQGNMVGKLEK